MEFAQRTQRSRGTPQAIPTLRLGVGCEIPPLSFAPLGMKDTHSCCAGRVQSVHAPNAGAPFSSHCPEAELPGRYALRSRPASQRGEPATCHTLRHSFATHRIESSVDIRPEQGLPGHSNVATTMICLRVIKRPGAGGPNPLVWRNLFLIPYYRSATCPMKRRKQFLPFRAAFVGVMPHATFYLQLPRAAQ